MELLKYLNSQIKVYRMNKWYKELNKLYVERLRMSDVNVTWGTGLVEEEYTLTVCFKNVTIIKILTKGNRAYLTLVSACPIKKDTSIDTLFLYISALDPICYKGNVSLTPAAQGLDMFYNVDLGTIYAPKSLIPLIGEMQYEMLNYWPLVLKNVDRKLGDIKAKFDEMFVQASDNDN